MVISKEDRFSQNKLRMKRLWLIPTVLLTGLFCLLFLTSTNPAKDPEETLQTVSIPESKTISKAVIESKVQDNVTSVNRPTLILNENFKIPNLIEEKLKAFPPVWHDFLKSTLDLSFVNELEKCTKLEKAVVLISSRIDNRYQAGKLESWLSDSVDI